MTNSVQTRTRSRSLWSDKDYGPWCNLSKKELLWIYTASISRYLNEKKGVTTTMLLHRWWHPHCAVYMSPPSARYYTAEQWLLEGKIKESCTSRLHVDILRNRGSGVRDRGIATSEWYPSHPRFVLYRIDHGCGKEDGHWVWSWQNTNHYRCQHIHSWLTCY